MADKYLAIIEQANDGSYSAYLPDVPGCVSSGDTIDEVKANIQEALDFHFEGMRLVLVFRFPHQHQCPNMSKWR